MSNYSTTTTSHYTYLWSKYRPAILKLMIDCAEGPQEYKFSNHEFGNLNLKKKVNYSFMLRVYQGRALNNIKSSEVAQDLLGILKQSPKASELMEDLAYEFRLDKDFVLHISQEEVPEMS